MNQDNYFFGIQGEDGEEIQIGNIRFMVGSWISSFLIVIQMGRSIVKQDFRARDENAS